MDVPRPCLHGFCRRLCVLAFVAAGGFAQSIQGMTQGDEIRNEEGPNRWYQVITSHFESFWYPKEIHKQIIYISQLILSTRISESPVVLHLERPFRDGWTWKRADCKSAIAIIQDPIYVGDIWYTVYLSISELYIAYWHLYSSIIIFDVYALGFTQHPAKAPGCLPRLSLHAKLTLASHATATVGVRESPSRSKGPAATCHMLQATARFI